MELSKRIKLVEDERYELGKKMQKLYMFINGKTFASVPQEQQDLLNQQYSVMALYKDILLQRIQAMQEHKKKLESRDADQIADDQKQAKAMAIVKLLIEQGLI